MPSPRALLLLAAALVAFAGNSILCRGALAGGHADPATFTLVRIGCGAAALLVLVRMRGGGPARPRAGAGARAAALFAYAALFSWAYVRVPAGVGALVLFASVQLTMWTAAVRAGAGPQGREWAGLAIALGGLAALTLPGASAPDAVGAALMAGSGVAWGVYSLLGGRSGSPLATTAVSFAAAVPLAIAGAGVTYALGAAHADGTGVALAAVSGAVTSGLGYAAWYAVLPGLGPTRAAVVQLLVPVLAAAAGVVLLGEAPTLRLLLSGTAILAGIAVVMSGRRGSGPPKGGGPS